MTMATWRECKLGDLIEVKHGFAFLGEHFGNTGTHVVVTPGNFLEEGGFKDRGDKAKWYRGPIPEDYVLNEGDILVAMTEQAEGLLGSSALIPRSGFYLHNQRLGSCSTSGRNPVPGPSSSSPLRTCWTPVSPGLIPRSSTRTSAPPFSSTSTRAIPNGTPGCTRNPAERATRPVMNQSDNLLLSGG